MKEAKKTVEKEITFESALAELESIVRVLEEGKADLDTTLEAYVRGVELVKVCNEKLEQAEQKVMAVQRNADGELAEVPYVAPKKGLE